MKPSGFPLGIVILIANLISYMQVIDMFRFYFNFSHSSLCLSRNLSISSKLSNMSAYSCLCFSLYPFYFCKVNSTVFSFISDFSNFSLLFLGQTSHKIVGFVDFFSKGPSCSFTHFLYCFSIACFIYFYSVLYCFLSSTCFMFSVSSSSDFLRWKIILLIF